MEAAATDVAAAMPQATQEATREAAQAKLFERLAPAVKQMHLDCTAGILEPNLEVGYAVAMQAAAAGGEPIQAGPVTPGDELMVEGKAVGIS